MNRRDFMARCAQLAAALPAISVVGGCADDVPAVGLYADFEVNFDGSVLIVGAGAAGLAAGYLLDRYGIDFQVLEASSRIGGRVKRSDDFADFPIDLGAEWIHEHPAILASLIDDPTVDGSIEVVPFIPQSISIRDGNALSAHNWAKNFYQEYKFKRTTWFGFLERYIAPAVLPRIRFDHPVASIDTGGSRVVVTTRDGARFEADRVVVTASVNVLQDGLIEFTPGLTPDQQDALAGVHMTHGIKVFSEFERRFYPDIVLDGGLFDDTSIDKLYYDAAFRKDTARHVMGLFWVSDAAARFTELEDDAAIVQAKLADLDRIFGGEASRYHVKSVVQNWTAEPFVRGAYSVDFEGGQQAFIDAFAPRDGRLFFAGEAYLESTVQGAMGSAYGVVEQLLAM